MDAPFYADVAELGDAAARGAVGRMPTRGATPLVRTNFFAAWLECRHGGLKTRWASCPCRCDSGRRDQLCGRVWNRRPGGLKNRRAARRVSVQVAPAAPDSFGEWWSVYTRVSETRGRKPMQVQVLSRRPISAPRPLTSPGDPPLERAMPVRVRSRRPLSPRSSK